MMNICTMCMLLCCCVSSAATPLTNSTSPDTPLYVFSHIPKVGGTSFEVDFRQLLRRAIGARPCEPVKAYFRFNGLLPLLRAEPHARSCNVVSAEVNLRTLRTHATNHTKVLMLFRNPLLLRVSIAEHANRDQPGGLKQAFPASPYDRYSRYFGWLEGPCCGKELKTSFNSSEQHRLALDRAVRSISDLDFVGITDFYVTTICLLLYDLGEFDAKGCQCPRPATGRYAGSQRNVKGGTLSFNQDELKRIGAANGLDALLYAHALELFRRRVQAAEDALGLRFFCELEPSHALKTLPKSNWVKPAFRAKSAPVKLRRGEPAPTPPRPQAAAAPLDFPGGLAIGAALAAAIFLVVSAVDQIT